jgi:hypothetical protein
MSEARWALTFHSYSSSVRAKKWYRVTRVAFVDCGWFELYWATTPSICGENKNEVRERANALGYDLLPGLFAAPRNNRRGNELVEFMKS